MSPPTKRIRLSSPAFQDDLVQEDIDAFDAIDAQFSQSVTRPLDDDDENPFCLPQTARIHPPFTTPSTLEKHIEQDDDNDKPPEVDLAAWFNPDPSNAFVGFSAAAAAMPGFQRPSANGASPKSLFVPSAAALRDAEEKLRKWQEEPQPPTCTAPDSLCSTQIMSPPRSVFASVRNAHPSAQAPETPTPAPSRYSLIESTPFKPLLGLGNKHQTKPFKSPLIGTAPSVPPHRQVSTPNIASPLRPYQSNGRSQLMPAASPLRPSSVVNQTAPQKVLGFTPRHGNGSTKPKFVTPFKVIAKPASIKAPISSTQPKAAVNRVYPPAVSSIPRSNKPSSDTSMFDLTPPLGRRTLAASGLWPQAYTVMQLEDMGINFKELSSINPRTAPFYTFTTSSDSPSNMPDSSSSIALGRLAALEELHAKGCTLAKQTWVDNHWPLILWKLAGMVALDPTSESDSSKKRWCWSEVIRQLIYRYERDLNSSSRPPLRLITTRDASAASPTILCISDIICPANAPEHDAASVQTLPELEVTDGWYRLRARIDATLARAVRKGKIKIGRKIAIVGAKLSAERKEGSEILEAYNSNVLLLTGNSTHMAPWHAKLGFQRGLFIATLNSLTADGGNVAVMMLSVIKAYPIAYIEIVEDTDGQKQRVGPHDAKEELKLSTQWKTRRESHASRLWAKYEKRRHTLLDYAERLEQHAGSKFKPTLEDDPPNEVYDLYDTLQEDVEAGKSIFSSINSEHAGWLARHIREKTVQEHDTVSEEVEQELESICPPRDVKAFCVVIVKDARTSRYPAERTAQVTVWDVPGMPANEDCATQSPFTPGQRYLVTNLVPSQPSAWMDRSSGGEVYLNTRKNSRWTLVK